MKLDGSCHCGAVSFAVESPVPYPYMRCYCSICRKTRGGVCIAGTVFYQVGRRPALSLDDVGEQQVKNIDRPIRAYRTQFGGRGSDQRSEPSEPLPLPDKPSIAVLPFVNMSADAGQEFFADGISEETITALSKFSTVWPLSSTGGVSRPTPEP